MKALFAALSFLTIFPFPPLGDFKKAPGFFPLVGLFLGTILWGLSLLLDKLPSYLVAFLVILSLIILTRGLHLDGLSDACDALMGAFTREEVLRIMRDPHIGTFGVLAIQTVIAGKILFLIPLLPQKEILFLFPTWGRTTVLLPMFFLPYLRERGKASPFYPPKRGMMFLGLVFSAFLSFLLLGFRGLFCLGICLLYGLMVSFYYRKRLGGYTGDLLGALIETTEVVGLLCLNLL